MTHPIKDVLVLRQFAKAFMPEKNSANYLKSVFKKDGTTVHYNGHNVTFLFPGYGDKIRQIPDEIIDKLNSGQITDIVDIGGGGALDPMLKKGDMVLSTGDVSVDGDEPLTTNRRPEAEAIFSAIAQDHDRAFTTSRILTTRKVIGPRQDRMDLFHKHQTKIVQMEHYWFMKQIKDKMDPQAWDKLFVTHLELVADIVPEDESFWKNAWGIIGAIDFCVIRNQKFVGTFKAEYLKRWLDGVREHRTAGLATSRSQDSSPPSPAPSVPSHDASRSTLPRS